MIERVFLLTTKTSGLTSPETNPAPSPKTLSIKAFLSQPVSGSAVNATPAATGSMAGWMTMAIRSSEALKRCFRAYAIALSVKRLA